MSPETAVNPPWRHFFASKHFQEHAVLVAVDEAHLIHEWLDGASLPVKINIFVIIVMLLTDFRGPDFRKAFKRIGGLRALTKVPFMCLTASAPPAIEAEILESVGLHDSVFIRQPINRPNIFYSILKKSGLSVSCLISHTVDVTSLNINFLSRKISVG